jgi:putative Holliday junction resolvase
MSRIIGIDIGEKRMGVAISDETQTLARGIEAIEVKSKDDCFLKIKSIIDKNNAKEVVVGLPLNMNGSRGPQAQRATAFIKDLEGRFSIPITAFDERLTTKQGERILIEADMSRKKRRTKIDSLAAQIMLQSYLDSKKEGRE